MYGAAIKPEAATGRAAGPWCASSGCGCTRAPQRRRLAPCCATRHGGRNKTNMQPSTPPEYIATPNPLADRTNWQRRQPQQRRQLPPWKRPFQTQDGSQSEQQLRDPDRWEEVLISPTGTVPNYVRYITALLRDAPPAAAHLLLLANHAPAATRAVTVLAAVDQVLAARGGVALVQPAVVDSGSSSSSSSRGGGQPSQQWQQPPGHPTAAPPAEGGQGGAVVPQLRLYLRMWPRGEGPSPYLVDAPQGTPRKRGSRAAASPADPAVAAADPAAAGGEGEGKGEGEGEGPSRPAGPPLLYDLGDPGRMGRTHMTSRATVPSQQAAFVLQDVMTKRGCYLAAAGGLAAANALLVLGLVRAALLRASSWADLVVRVDKMPRGGRGAEARQQQQQPPGGGLVQREQAEGAWDDKGGRRDDSDEAEGGSSSSSSSSSSGQGPVVYRFTVVKAIRAHPGCRWPVPLAPMGPGWAPARHAHAAAAAAKAARQSAASAPAKQRRRRRPWHREQQQQQQQEGEEEQQQQQEQEQQQP